MVQADDSQQKSLTEELNIYYDEVIVLIGDAKSILIFGPGEAKGELKKRLEDKKMGKLIAGIETAGEMTEAQITAKVRECFSK